ncbi:MAG: hypothetical protein FWD03_08380 [Defluviitaleaceae bacterium]|nr:hypothetical protein [Defluviitaleaceae bacterium]
MEQTKKSYQLVCYAYYCGWKSEVTDDPETLKAIEKCPRCSVRPGPKLKIEEIE